ncbi:hypothetical protein MT325_m483R [Paramecium bursaria chlorella virus MT325]|uniref:Uncharacterized protein m483R n=1 Tax=Paramecium bursaria Chlorella virus MT325 TaxID=346932 RepID=A7IUL3_PBCVM|nr:hypothetical protein MT325_m483R [Paramecium bursaria chlorella virus MT325]
MTMSDHSIPLPKRSIMLVTPRYNPPVRALIATRPYDVNFPVSTFTVHWRFLAIIGATYQMRRNTIEETRTACFIFLALKPRIACSWTAGVLSM